MTHEEYNQMAAALRKRGSDELAAFVESLLLDHETGVGDYARAFAAPDCVTAAQIIEGSISGWATNFRHDTYHQAGAAAQRLDWTLEAIERCVSPRDPQRALALIVRFFEGDDDLRQDELDNISDAFRRATILFCKIAKACPANQVDTALKRLSVRDDNGYRSWLQDETLLNDESAS